MRYRPFRGSVAAITGEREQKAKANGKGGQRRNGQEEREGRGRDGRRKRMSGRERERGGVNLASRRRGTRTIKRRQKGKDWTDYFSSRTFAESTLGP